MPFYFPLESNFSPEDSERTAHNLLRLRQQIRAEIPPRTVNDTFLLATWNIRDFDSNKFGHGPRLKESLFYIAEIIAAFDLVAVQEVNEDLSAIKTVLQILGSNWDYITTDRTEGRSGNRERMTFLYDTRKVTFQKIAGEIVLPIRKGSDEQQFARTPFMAAFESGWFRFMICSVHIYYGSSSGEKLQRRIDEIENIAKFLAKRADEESANYIVLGDFNIVSPDHKTMEALTRHGFIVPEGLSQLPSNMKLNKHYDQIGFKARDGQVQFGGHSGVFNFYESLFREEDINDYLGKMKNLDQLEMNEDGGIRPSEHNKKYYLDTWRSFQMSDHLPMWIELKIDFADKFLHDLINPSFAYKPAHPMAFSMPELEQRD